MCRTHYFGYLGKGQLLYFENEKKIVSMWCNRLLIPFLIIVGIVVFSCNKKSELDDQVKEFCSKTVIIPSEKMELRFCSFYSDTVQTKKKWHYYTYVDGSDCQKCEIGKIAINEKAHMGKIPQLEFSYIVRTSKEESDYIYRKFCNARIEGTLYLDTCDAFRSANPHIPDRKLFHAFVVDGTGRVLFVGNPFQNDKMENVFLKVVENELKEDIRKS